MFDLTGQAALVTGSSRGIGFAAARALGRQGARVILNGRDLATRLVFANLTAQWALGRHIATAMFPGRQRIAVRHRPDIGRRWRLFADNVIRPA